MLKYATVSKIGTRQCNEDYIRTSTVSNRNCFVVCDGLGGHKSGDVAAHIVGNTFIDEFFYCTDASDYLLNTFELAQKKIRFEQERQCIKGNMQTTAVCLIVDENIAYVGHVGDSRFYGFKIDKTYIRTQDHSIPQLLVKSGTIEESKIRNHPNRNMLLKALGDKSNEQLCDLLKPIDLDEYSALLLCTDGFWELITEDDMMSTLQNSNSVQEWLDKMTKIVENNGMNRDMDNYSAIALIV